MNSGPDRAELERQKQSKELEVEIWKSRNKENEEVRFNLAKDLEKIQIELELIEEEKFNLESTINEKSIKIL